VNEISKSIARRLHTPGFATHYFVGNGLDVGSGDDSLGKYARLFPLIRLITDFDLPEPVRIEQLHMTFQRGIGRVDQT